MNNSVAWRPLPGSQTLALSCPCNEILYDGTRGGGKSEVQLAYYVARCGRGYGAKWRGIIFDRGYKNLDDLIAKSLKMIPDIFPKAKFLTSKSDLRWVFPDGEELLFRHIKKAEDYRQYHGHEYPFIGWNELTSFPTSELYDLMSSCNRSSYIPSTGQSDMPLVTFSTTNPHGPGHNWVKRKFIDPSPAGVPSKTKTKVFDPRQQKDVVVERTVVRLFSSYRENIYLDPIYIASLHDITDPNKRKAWLQGDWEITSGGALDDLWRANVHKLPRFIIPKNWKLTRSFDWGSSHPFSVGFWAIANGEEIRLPNGKIFCPQRGSMIRIGEIYGCEQVKDGLGQWRPAYGTNKGVKASAKEVARQINEYIEELTEDGWIQSKVEDGPADGQIYSKNEAETLTIAKLMELEGITWYPADKSAGSRKMGLEIIRGALESALQGEGAGLYVMDNCDAFLETVPSIPRDEKDPDDVDTNSEDHVFDEVRYCLLDNKPTFAGSISVGVAM